MRARERASAFDISIRGDELEYNRIQLEHNLQHTELSFRLSSASDDEQPHPKIRHRRKNNPNNSSVEYPRHLSEPSFHEFSIARSAGDHYGDEDSQAHPWSYRVGDDEEGINPYGGDTVSTAAHHASALTLSAGLGGGRAARRDASLSGAEYDPERPLHAMIAGVNSKHSMFDLDRSKSKVQVAASMTYDPLVVDSTAELDRILESGRAPPPSLRLRSVRVASPTSSASSSAIEGAHGQQVQAQLSPRPKLADHLRHVSFSPKRPRSAQSNHSNPGSPFPRVSSQKWEDNASMNMPRLRPARRPHVFPSYASPVQPEVRLQPATPSTRPTPQKSMRETKIYLPDVTGLANAVDSPAKPGTEYYSYRTDNRSRDGEARLLQTLSAVQSQLRDLQDENCISRRRVRELELELEECKRHVVRERTRLIEREELNDIGYVKTTQNKGKGRAAEPPAADIDDGRLHERYKEAVDEKKALEALINSLRSHLTRLTSELASHQDLLTELRNLRHSDSQALKEKGADILKLREEVQRLAGEVEVLRGVVEEGLKERRTSREIHVEHSVADVAMSHDLEEEEEEEEGNKDEDVPEEDDSDEILSDEDEDEPFDPVSIHEASSRANQADKTMRTDFATIGSTNLTQSTSSRRFVDEEELDRIAAEVEERRSNRSSSSIGSQARSPSPIRRDRQATVEGEEENERPPQPSNISHHSQSRLQTILQPEPSTSRPSAVVAGYSPKQAIPPRFQDLQDEPETPFPQIRGEHLERLFFSAPEHNAKTCTVCYRRRHRTGGSPSWSYPRKSDHARNTEEEQEDEGFGEGSDGAADIGRVPRDSKGKQRDYVNFSKDPGHWRQAGRKEGLPPQTVIARVIRELEDDFTHYKSIYVELADQYKVMDAVSDVPRRNMLARHLREVVDILEQKGDQIASLYDLLSFKDKPIVESIIPDTARSTARSWDKPLMGTR